jgi:hypothetical protein
MFPIRTLVKLTTDKIHFTLKNDLFHKISNKLRNITQRCGRKVVKISCQASTLQSNTEKDVRCHNK